LTDIQIGGVVWGFGFVVLFAGCCGVLEKINRREELVSEAGAGVAELGQTRNKQERG